MSLRDQETIRRMAPAAIEHYGRIDILVNNAGCNVRKPAIDVTWEDWNLVLDTNLRGSFFVATSLAPHMMANGYGRIINIGSVTSVFGYAGIGPSTNNSTGTKDRSGQWVQVAMCLGLRVSEILALRWEEVDLLNLEINIVRSSVGKHQSEETKTDASNASLPLHEDLGAELAAWKEVVPVVNGWVFGFPVTGRPYHRDSLLQGYLRPAAKAVSMVNVGWHSFRHTYRAHMSVSGLPIEIQQKLMRHSDIQMTSKYGQTSMLTVTRPANAKIIEMLRRTAA